MSLVSLSCRFNDCSSVFILATSTSSLHFSCVSLSTSLLYFASWSTNFWSSSLICSQYFASWSQVFFSAAASCVFKLSTSLWFSCRIDSISLSFSVVSRLISSLACLSFSSVSCVFLSLLANFFSNSFALALAFRNWASRCLFFFWSSPVRSGSGFWTSKVEELSTSSSSWGMVFGEPTVKEALLLSFSGGTFTGGGDARAGSYESRVGIPWSFQTRSGFAFLSGKNVALEVRSLWDSWSGSIKEDSTSKLTSWDCWLADVGTAGTLELHLSVSNPVLALSVQPEAWLESL